MHIPDGYLGPKTFGACYVAVAPFWWGAWRFVRARMRSASGAYIPHVALAAAFVFVLMMFNVPVPGGTTGHAVGASVAAIALGFWPTVLAVSFALVLQALLFADGGITALGANCLNMAVIQPAVSLFVWNLLRPRELGEARGRTFWAAFLAGYIGLLAAAFATAIQFGLQPVLERAGDGAPLYSPFPLRIAVPAMVLTHLVIGILEGAVTGFLVAALARRPAESGFPLAPSPVIYRRKSFWGAVAAVIVAVPLGLWLPRYFGAGAAWGEWSPEQATQTAGLKTIPKGMSQLSRLWQAPVPDYALSGSSGGAGLQYVFAALGGVVLITIVFLALGKWQKARLRALESGRNS